jgi:uncharacterized membrane protein YeaQ/YmgE (transglycosylase-associated protein family)
MGLLLWIVVGAAAGVGVSWLYRHTVRAAPLNPWVNGLVGVVGAVAGGFSANLVTRHPVLDVSWESLFVGFLGAGVFLAVANAVQRR